jgi:hypothetical protein
MYLVAVQIVAKTTRLSRKVGRSEGLNRCDDFRAGNTGDDRYSGIAGSLVVGQSTGSLGTTGGAISKTAL